MLEGTVARSEDLTMFCPLYRHAIELIGRRWNGDIVYCLLAGGRRFTEIRTAVPDISDRLLAVRLRELQAEGVVEREVVATASGPARAEYRLTAKGRALRPVIDAVAAVGRMWSAESPDQAALR